jgi:hypothetical protein
MEKINIIHFLTQHPIISLIIGGLFIIILLLVSVNLMLAYRVKGDAADKSADSDDDYIDF